MLYLICLIHVQKPKSQNDRDYVTDYFGPVAGTSAISVGFYPVKPNLIVLTRLFRTNET